MIPVYDHDYEWALTIPSCTIQWAVVRFVPSPNSSVYAVVAPSAVLSNDLFAFVLSACNEPAECLLYTREALGNNEHDQVDQMCGRKEHVFWREYSPKEQVVPKNDQAEHHKQNHETRAGGKHSAHIGHPMSTRTVTSCVSMGVLSKHSSECNTMQKRARPSVQGEHSA